MKRYNLRPLASKRVNAGQRLLQVDDFEHAGEVEHLEEGTVIMLTDQNRQSNAKAIIGRQNKGIGWIFTHDGDEFWEQELVHSRFESAIKTVRQSFFETEETTAFRLFNGEGDGIGGVTVDWYDGFIQINWYSRGIHSYRDWIMAALIDLLPEIKGVYETKRFKVSADELAIEHTQGETAPQPLVILENDIKYAVYLGEDWMTGIFFDQREVRQYIQTQSQDLTVLNLFSYTGAFSVAAAVGGAAKTVSVDVANRSNARTKEQFELNGLVPEQPDHEVRVMDVFDYIAYAKRHQLKFDLIVCDPPSFARTKKYVFKADLDYAKLTRDLFEITAPGGLCIVSTNHSGYKREDFQEDMSRVGREFNNEFHMIQSFGLPEDFPTSPDVESQYLKVLSFYRQA